MMDIQENINGQQQIKARKNIVPLCINRPQKFVSVNVYRAFIEH